MGGSGIPDQPRLHCEFEVSLVYLRPRLKKPTRSEFSLPSTCTYIKNSSCVPSIFAINDNDVLIKKKLRKVRKKDRGKEEMNKRMRKKGRKGERGRNGKEAGKEGRW